MAEKKVAVSLDLLLNELKNVRVENLSSAPQQAVPGRMYFNTGDKTLYYGADSKWNPIATGGSVEEALKSLSLTFSGTTLSLNGNGSSSSVDLDTLKGFVVATLYGKNSASVVAKTAGYNLRFTETTDIEFNSTEFASGNVQPTIKSLSANKIADFSVEISGNKMTFYGGSGSAKKALHTLDITSLAKDGMLDGAALLTATDTTGTVTVNSVNHTVSGLTKGRTYIVFVWKTGSGKEAMPLDVTTLIDVYTPGEGLKLENNQFSIKLGGQDEGYLAFDGNGYLVTEGINDKISKTVASAKDEVDKTIAQLTTTVNKNSTAVLNHEDDLKTAKSNIDALRVDVDSNSKKYDTILGSSSDASDANTIYGIRKYATNVARLMGGFNFTKEVTSGTSVNLFAGTTVGATNNSSSYMVDLESISVRTNTGEQIEVEVKKTKDAETPVMLAWSGITPTSSSPLIINYRVILAQTGA